MVADKVVKIIEKFQPKIAKIGSFQEAVIEGSVLTLTASSSDELFMDLLHRAHSDRITELAKGTSPIFATISEPLWRPIVEEAQKRGEARPDLSATEIITWINQSHFLILLQDPSPKEIRSFMRNFVYPAIAPDASIER